jgi:hypothetical protein
MGSNIDNVLEVPMFGFSCIDLGEMKSQPPFLGSVAGDLDTWIPTFLGGLLHRDYGLQCYTPRVTAP